VRERLAIRLGVLGVLGVAGITFLAIWRRSGGPEAFASIDTFQYFCQNMLYAVHSVQDGFRGFLWNSLQNCGQPFLGIGSTSVLYPLHALFLVLDAGTALYAVLALNLLIGGAFTFLLCRELGTSVAAAVCGALTFELGASMLELATWSPFVVAPYPWMPAAMLCCERLSKAPSTRTGVALGFALAVALLGGMPQVVFFIYQLVALRVVWELATRRGGPRLALLGTVSLGLVLGPLLAAVGLVPGLEAASASVRGSMLTPEEIGGYIPLSALRGLIVNRREIGNALIFLPCVLAAASVIGAARRRQVWFYLLAGALYVALALGPDTPLFGLYLRMPLGSLFRGPQRFLWVTGFCLAVLTAFGVDALAGEPDAASGPLRRWGALLASATLLLAAALLAPGGLRPIEWGAAALVLLAGAAATFAPAWRRPALIGIVALLALTLLSFPRGEQSDAAASQSWAARELPFRRTIDSRELLAHAALFRTLRPRMTPQDRAYLVYGYPSPAFNAKTGSLFGVPVIQDYEPQPSRRSAEYWMYMRNGSPMQSLSHFYHAFHNAMPPTFQRHLLDLAGGRFLVVSADYDPTASQLRPAPHLLWESEGLRVYENPRALPRAVFVPRVEVVADPLVLLQRLAAGDDDPRQVALIESAPPSGFLGDAATPASATVEFVRDDPEHVVLRLRADGRGFLHLADQYFSGWRATINGTETPIMRANYLFRLIEIPPGESLVEFRYEPASVRIGAFISIATLLSLAVLGIVARRRRRSRERSAMR
jgi:hypothetical protein